MRKKKLQKSDNLKLAFVFFFVLLGIVCFSFIIKLFLVVKNSHFDGQHRFTLAIESTHPEVISFDPGTSTISIVSIKKQFGNGVLAQFLGIPIDATVATNMDTQAPVASQLKVLLVHHAGGRSVNLVDLARLLLFTQGVSPNSYKTSQLNGNEDTKTVDVTLSSFFTDATIVSENKQIEIINASGISGFGNRLARVITNMGGQVILVKTADQLRTASSLAIDGNMTYTAEKLQNFLHVSLTHMGQGTLADIVITLGTDMTGVKSF